jgi:hypothetical protein
LRYVVLERKKRNFATRAASPVGRKELSSSMSTNPRRSYFIESLHACAALELRSSGYDVCGCSGNMGFMYINATVRSLREVEVRSINLFNPSCLVM